MRKVGLVTYAALMVSIFVAWGRCFAAVPMIISYQGKLSGDNGQMLEDGIYNMRFYLYDQQVDGNLLWQEPASGQQASQVQITGGFFNILLGSVVPLTESAFPGNTWLQTEVNGQMLSPRMQILSAGYAIHAQTSDTVADGAVTTPKLANDAVTTSKLAEGAVTNLKVSDVAWSKLTGVPAGLNDGDNDTTYTAGDGLSLVGTRFFLDTAYTGGLYWKLGGNSGTNPVANFLGTTDNQPLELRVNGGRAFRLEPNVTSPNVVGGYFGNNTLSGVYGGAIGGGGSEANANLVTDSYGVVAGGLKNQAGDNAGTATDRKFATVSGGNMNAAGGSYSVVAGGGANTASGLFSTIGGGSQNIADGSSSTVPGGTANAAQGNYSFAAGRQAKANHKGAFVWGDSTPADFASTADDQFLIRASGGVGIGVTDPAAGTLDVNGLIRSRSGGFAFQDGTTQTSAGFTGSGTDNYIPRLNGTKALENSAIYQTDTGRIGIGTTSPSALLHASGSTTIDAVRGYTTGGTGSSAGYFQISNQSNLSSALEATTNGGGHAVFGFTSGTGNAVQGTTYGTGDAMRGYTTGGTGSNAGSFEIDNNANTGAALYAITSGSGPAVQADGLLQVGSNPGKSGDLKLFRNGSANPVARAYTSAAGGNFQMFDELGNSVVKLEADSSGSGGYLRLDRGVGQIGFELDGNFLGSGASAMSISGPDRDVIFNTALSGNSSVELPVDAISSSEMLNEPGVMGRLTTSSWVLGNGYTTLMRGDIDCPAAGYVLVIASCAVYALTDSDYFDTSFGISDTMGAFSHDYYSYIGDEVDWGRHFTPITIHGLFPATAGTNTYFLVAYKNKGDVTLWDRRLSLIYFPTAYGAVSTLSGTPQAGGAGTQVGRPSILADETSKQNRAGERPESMSARTARMEQELAALKAEIEALKSHLKDRQ